MAASATAKAAGGETMDLPIHRLDVDTYNRIVDSGALDGQRVELLDGVLTEMSPQSPAHVQTLLLLTRHFAGAAAWLMVQMPIEVAPDSAPEPDIALLAQRPPRAEHARTALMAIEVAVSSQQLDRDVKGPLYARAGIPTYWLIDVPARTVEVYTEPGENGYAQCQRHTTPGTLSCDLDGVADLALADLFENT